MKILYLVTQAEEAGAQKYVLLLSRHFRGEVAAGSDSDWLFEQATNDGLRTHRLKFLVRPINPVYDLLAIAEIFLLLKKVKPDLVHLNSSKAGLPGAIAARLARCKVLFTAHGFTFHQPGLGISKGLFLLFEKIAAKLRDYTITVCEADKTFAEANGLAKPGRVTCVYNGLQPLPFLDPAEAKQSLNLPSGKMNAVTVANLYYRKGLDVLIQAAALCQNLNLHFTIIGEGPMRSELESLVVEKSLKNVSFIGAKPDAWEYLHAFDLFILPSRNEAMPYVLIEALQAGLPIIATDTGGVKEVLGTAGAIVEKENSAKLAEAIKYLATDTSFRTTLSAQALAQSEKFTLENCLGATEKIYGLLAGGSTKSS